MFASDPETGIEFLIDTGSCYSFLPYRRRTAPHLITDYLNAVNGTEIPSYGSKMLQISLNSGQLFTWQFKRAEVGYPIIGYDFLKKFNILTDPCNNTLTFPNSYSGQPSMVNERTNFEHVGMSKAQVAKESVLKLCPSANITAIHDSIFNSDYNMQFFKLFDLVLNALDNRSARMHVNRMCLAANIPLVESGSAGYLGQVTVIKKGVTS